MLVARRKQHQLAGITVLAIICDLVIMTDIKREKKKIVWLHSLV